MNWLDRLERKYPHLALEGLIRYVSFLMLTVFFLTKSGLLDKSMLLLNGSLVMHGQVWRLITFLLIPASENIFFLVFELVILVMCADGLEAEWGTFKLTIYYLIGAIGNIIMALILPNMVLNGYFIYLTLFLGFASLYPNYEIYLFFIIPIKIKYLAMLSGAWIIYTLVVAPLPAKIAVLIAIANYLLFFGLEFVNTLRGNYRAYNRQRKFETLSRSSDTPRHICSICGRTEVSNPELQFRYCTCEKCGENGVAFCLEHLKEHKSASSKENQK